MAVTVMVNLHSLFYKVDANSNKLFGLLEAHSPFLFQYRLLTMTTFFELIAVYIISTITRAFQLSGQNVF